MCGQFIGVSGDGDFRGQGASGKFYLCQSSADSFHSQTRESAGFYRINVSASVGGKGFQRCPAALIVFQPFCHAVALVIIHRGRRQGNVAQFVEKRQQQSN